MSTGFHLHVLGARLDLGLDLESLAPDPGSLAHDLESLGPDLGLDPGSLGPDLDPDFPWFLAAALVSRAAL